MLFQTLLQLNILIYATPALAGWVVAPLGHAGPVRQVSLVWQMRAVEAAPPKAEAPVRQERLRAVRLCPVVAVRPVPARPVNQIVVFADAPSARLAAFYPFPHAIRAP